MFLIFHDFDGFFQEFVSSFLDGIDGAFDRDMGDDAHAVMGGFTGFPSRPTGIRVLSVRVTWWF